MTKAEYKSIHMKRHNTLHQNLDELVEDFMAHTNRLPSNTTIIELMEWSAKQCINPTERGIDEL